jgi:LmbE family N-acetylglucosaminyl deacetylase
MTNGGLRLLGIFAHPDDETLGTGGTFARYADEGVQTAVLTATRGEYGWFEDPSKYPGPEALGQIREREFYAATAKLGVSDQRLLDYIDGELDQANPRVVIAQMADLIRELRPQVVVTFAHDGIYGHPDHIAGCQFATAAVQAAADPSCVSSAGGPHQVQKLYYRAMTEGYVRAYEAAFGELVMNVDGQRRESQPWAPWVITTRIDTAKYADQVWSAVEEHRSQLPGYEKLKALPAEHHEALWGHQEYYRVFSLVNGGRDVEDDLFAGLR